jgi:putative membrane protein
MTHAHPGQPLAPHDLWTAWNLDPLLICGLVIAALVYLAGSASRRPRGTRWQARCFVGAMAVLFIALVSPLDALSGVLASAHMVQHLLLMLVAAPLLALSAPMSTLLRGTPVGVRRAVGRWRARLRLTRANTRLLFAPGTVWLLHVGTLWFWHAAVPYDAALEHQIVHDLEHGTFLLTAALFWWVVVQAGRPGRMSPGFGVLLVFATAMQSVFLSALLTFAQTPWYSGYAETTRSWGLEPLGDQQLAGVVMWIPGGVIYVVTALLLLMAWIRHSEPGAEPDHAAPTEVRYAAERDATVPGRRRD